MERDEEEGREEGRRVGKICKRLGEQRKRTGRLFMGAILRIYELVPVESSRDVASRLLPVENVYRDVYIPGVSPWPRFARGHPSTRRHTSFLILPLPKTLNGERWREGGRCLSRISSRNRYARITIDIYIYIYVGRSSGTFSIFGGAKSYSRVVILLEEDGEGAGKCA